MDRVGTRYVQIDPKKIVAVVETNLPDAGNMLDKQNPMCQQIADNVVTFLLQEMAHGRIPPEFLPLQSGVGNINNAVMARLGENPEIPPFMMYSEVLQESVVHLLETGKISGASASSLTISADITFFARSSQVGALPIPLVNQTRPSGASADASMTATSMSPKKP